MKPNQALKFFKTRQAMVEAAGVTKQAVAVWFRKDLIPLRSAIALAVASKGRLHVNTSLYAK